jgi:hypothetical protein
VDETCITCASAVRENLFVEQIRPNHRKHRLWTRLSSLASLDPAARGRRIRLAFPQSFDARDVPTAVHRYRELIAGHPYLIEVSSVSSDRWRAYIVRIPGLPTALMPFYGTTPDAAAGLLRDWLARAHQRAGTSRIPQ